MGKLHAYAKAFQDHMGTANDRLVLAGAYIADGALVSGSKLLREAADELDKAHEARENYMNAGAQK